MTGRAKTMDTPLASRYVSGRMRRNNDHAPLAAGTSPRLRAAPGASRRPLPALLAAFFFLAVFPAGLLEARAEAPGLWQPLIARLAADGFDRPSLDALFASGDVEFDPGVMAKKVDSMVRSRFDPKPKPTKATLEKSAYRRFLTPWTLTWAGQFIDENLATLESAESAYGPPKEIITAILLVETKLGSYLGEKNALSVLAGMALCKDFSLVQGRLKSVGKSSERLEYARKSADEKADWAYEELKALLRYAEAKNQSPLSLPGSIYGAIGICQFMPTNALKFGVDADDDGRIDLFTTRDAIYSVANYLRGHGWRADLDEEGRKEVIYAYNHSDLYVLAVMTVADQLRERRAAKK